MFKKYKVWIITVSILIIAAIGLGIFYFTKPKEVKTEENTNQNSVQTQSNDQIPAQETKTTEIVKFNLYKEDGQVSYKPDQNASYQELKEDQIELPDKSFIKTNPGSLAHIIFNDNSMISLDENTEIQVIYDGASRNINQNSGNTWHRIQKLVDSGSYQVETSNTLATVRGTIFGVKIENAAQTSLYVLESQVEVNQMANENGKKVPKETQMVRENKHMGIPDFDGNKKMLLTDIPEDKKNTGWFKRNRLIDDDYKKEKAINLIEKIKNDKDFKQKLKDVLKDQNTPKETVINKVLGRLLPDSPNIDKNTLSNPDATTAALDPSNYSCSDLTGVVDFNNGLSALEQSGQIPAGTVDALKNYYSRLSDFCKDGNLDNAEIERLSVLAQTMSKSFSSLANPDAVAADPNAGANIPDEDAGQKAAYQSEIQAKLAQWTTVDPQTQSADLCALYSQSNVTIIVAQFVAIEQKYNQTASIAGKIKPLITQFAIACRDGSIDDAETQEIAKLYPNAL